MEYLHSLEIQVKGSEKFVPYIGPVADLEHIKNVRTVLLGNANVINVRLVLWKRVEAESELALATGDID